MNILRAFSSGFRQAVSEWKLILLLYSVNLLVAIPLALALRASLGSGLDQSMAPSNLMEGLDLSIMGDFLNHHGDGVGAVLLQIPWMLLAYTLINTLLAGGILTVVRDRKDKFSASEFFGGCGAYFLRFLRLFLIFGILLVVVIFVLGGVMSGIVSAISENATSELTDYWAKITLLTILSLPALLIVTVADYAKIMVVVNDEHSMLRTAWRSTKLVFRFFFRTFGLALLMVLVPVVLLVIYVWLDLSIGMSSGLTILLMFVIQQLFVVSKAWTKVFFFAGELSLYPGLHEFGSQAPVPTFRMPSSPTTAV